MDSLLQIQNLSVDFKTDKETTTALHNISFEIGRREIVGIVGESGSGKTVSSLSILRLLPLAAQIKSGKILLDTRDNTIDLLKISEEQIRDLRGNEIAMVFQEPMTSLNPVLTCGKQIAESLILHKKKTKTEAKKITIGLFEKVKLPNPSAVYNRYPHELSGGQKQRVMIAMAISCNPSLLIADEPTTALDVTVQQTIIELLKELQQEFGMSVMYITHDLNLVSEIADRIVVMYKGEIVEQGPAKQIFNSPGHPYTKALLACRPSTTNKGRRLPMISDFMKGDSVNKESKESSETKKTSTDDLIIDVKNLVVSFPKKKNLFGKTLETFNAVDDVSFNIKQQETLGLVGESGCGKTTLGRTLIRLINPTSGSIYYNNKDIATLKEEELRLQRKEMQIVFQDPYGSLNPRITIGEAIQEPLIVHNPHSTLSKRKEKVIELLEKVDLKPDHFNRYPHQFSGGQRQRICVARALGLNPDFLICDESVSALDVSVQAQVLNLLNDLKKELGFACLFISHDLNVVRYISDRIIVMNKGKIVEEGLADDIYFNPKDAYTQKLIDSIPKGLSV